MINKWLRSNRLHPCRHLLQSLLQCIGFFVPQQSPGFVAGAIGYFHLARPVGYVDWLEVEVEHVGNLPSKFVDRQEITVQADIDGLAIKTFLKSCFNDRIHRIVDERKTAYLFAVSINVRLTALEHEIHHDGHDVSIGVYKTLPTSCNAVWHQVHHFHAMLAAKNPEAFLRRNLGNTIRIN